MSRETAEEKGKKGEKESEEIGTETEKEESFPPQKVTKGVGILLGDPEKAVIKLSIPIIVAMSVQTIYSLTDTFWVAGLGADALAAVGFAFPFFVIQMALTSGLGVGGGAAISRRIGARDKTGVDNVAVHTFIIMLILTVALTVIGLAVVRDLFMYSGAGETTPLGVAYARVIFAGSFVFFFTNVANSILRSEGDSKRAMQSMVLGSVLNIILDPIFIYVLGLGVAGAALATVVSFASSGMLMFYWFFVKRNTYVSFVFHSFKFDRAIVKDIFRVGIPSSVEQVALALTALIMNRIIVTVSSTDGVAVYATAWRITSIAVAPLIGIAISVVSISGAAFGEKNYKKARSALIYATRTGFLVEAAIAVAVYVFAQDIAAAFTQAENTAQIAPELIRLLKIMTVFYPAVAFGMLSASLFQGAGKGTSALIATLLRSLILTPVFALLFAYTFDWGLLGVWWGLVTGTVIGSLVTFAWAQVYLRCIIKAGDTGEKC
ncbi:Multi antimicrobial extrusion protein (Na(+)/drug antiporter), MATE family of MDR efflux pumps [Methanosarcina horonobensis HB-1 = JCM 15518]|uniref:Multi antimicrobial extrusion protein (Na(+)/drug antiporter), MATE family of MDR efflux pumps n=1 Tax=Methanosarcina horonobensis HB-1 = JCM 15518 TaxID=1434110 RepID=A0A0E3S802_9EURY|nr:MATE family efflux transporter [Methanosarcina horonobensis]AKB77564.1 Multi antimicrobial extrusion protein (Na(+)/drug antiporter), MATE family of MDR efflux pumps [Methanosarcina horonobensis HB-1 = JCM 15518]